MQEEKEEPFKKILNANDLLLEEIANEKKRQETVDEEWEDFDEWEEDQPWEEIYFEEEFKEVNIVKTNAEVITIKIPTNHADA